MCFSVLFLAIHQNSSREKKKVKEKETKRGSERDSEREMAQINGFYYFLLSPSRFSSTLYITMRRRKKKDKINRGRNNHKRVPNRCEYLVDEQNFTNDIEFQIKASVYRHLTWKFNKHQIKCKLRNNSHQRKFSRFICIEKKCKWYSPQSSQWGDASVKSRKNSH